MPSHSNNVNDLRQLTTGPSVEHGRRSALGEHPYAISDFDMDLQSRGFDPTAFALLIVAAYRHPRLRCGFSSPGATKMTAMPRRRG